jgi:hypothetical protein
MLNGVFGFQRRELGNNLLTIIMSASICKADNDKMLASSWPPDVEIPIKLGLQHVSDCYIRAGEYILNVFVLLGL